MSLPYLSSNSLESLKNYYHDNKERIAWCRIPLDDIISGIKSKTPTIKSDGSYWFYFNRCTIWIYDGKWIYSRNGRH